MSLIFVQNKSDILDLIPKEIKKQENCIIYNNQNINDIINLIHENIVEITFVYSNINNNINIPFFTHNIGNYFYFSNDIIQLFQYIKNLNGKLKVNLIGNNLDNIFLTNEIKIIEQNLGITITTDKNIPYLSKFRILTKKTLPLTLEQLPSEYFQITTNNDIRTCTLLNDISLSDIPNWTNSDTYIVLHTNDIFDGNNYTITVPWSNEGIFESDATSAVNMPIIQNLKVNSMEISDLGGSIVRREQRFFKVDNCTSNSNIKIFGGGIAGAFSGQNDGQCIITNCNTSGNKFKIIYNNQVLNDISLNSFLIKVFYDIIQENKNYFITKWNVDKTINVYFSDSSKNSINLFSLLNEFKYMAYGGIVGAFAATNGNCQIENCKFTGDSYVGSGGICAPFAALFYGNCDISGCSSNGNIFGLSGGICAPACGSYYGLLNVNNCFSKGSFINSLSGGISAGLSILCKNIIITNSYSTGVINGSAGIVCFNIGGNLYIQNCYSSGDINVDSAGIVATNIEGNLYIQNCYSTGKNTNKNSGGILSNSGGGLGNIVSNTSGENRYIIIISNCYTTGINLIQNAEKEFIYIFNSYSSTNIYNTKDKAKVYYNDKEITNNMKLNLLPITNKIDTSKQVSDIYLRADSTIIEITKWDTQTIWNTPTEDTSDNSIYPTLKYKDFNIQSNILVNKLTLDNLPSQYFQTIQNNKGGFTTTLLTDINLNEIENWKKVNTFIIMGNNDIFDGNNKQITVPWLSVGLFLSYGDSKGSYPNIKNLTVNYLEGIDIFGGGIILPFQRYFKVENCKVNGKFNYADNIKGTLFEELSRSSAGISGFLCAHTYGELIINNCSFNGPINVNSGICGWITAFFYGKCTISNSYSTGNIGTSIGKDVGGAGISQYMGLYNGSCLISNCYSKGNIINGHGITSDIFAGNVIIENSYASGKMLSGASLIGNLGFSNCAIYNSYCNGKLLTDTSDNLISSNLYYNSTTKKTTTNINLSLTPITNILNSSQQVSNIGTINFGSLSVTPEKWDIKNTWTIPTLSTIDDDTYPTLKTNP